ncbi:MAG TPA: hypothetical protein VEC19_10445 [Usitatibacter sp.]|nr:hypothetical protein [Usitatibacter sp.]
MKSLRNETAHPAKRLARAGSLAALVAMALLAASHPLAQKKDATVAAAAKNGDALVVDGKEVAQLRNVEGNVLLSQETGLASGDEAARVREGWRVITTAKSKAVVVFDDGCEVELKENQRLEIDTTRECKLRVTQAQSILLEPGGMAAAAASAGATGGAAAAILAGVGGSFAAGFAGFTGLTGLATLIDHRESSAVSPS